RILHNMIYREIVPILKAKNIGYQDVFSNVTEAFMLKLKLSFMVGLIIVLPFALLQIWGFVSPALKPNEKKPFKVLAPISVLLFATGVGFGWWVTPNALRWFTSYVEEFPGTALYQQPGLLIFFVMKMLLAFGLSFELPLIVYALGALGLLQAQTL